jgi:hypothetical protein
MRALVFCVLWAAWAASGLFPGVAWGQGDGSRAPAAIDSKPVGKVQNVTGSVTIEHSGGVVVQANLPGRGVEQTKVDDPVYQGDVVQTGADGTIGIIFGDGTSFNISKNARMEINEFVYDPKGNSNSTLFNLTKGTFTFLAGKTAKTGNMRVETPVGTMGIRGTAPHVEISDDGTVKFTTLVEENKNAETSKPAPVTAPRPRQNQKPSPSLNICRNC